MSTLIHIVSITDSTWGTIWCPIYSSDPCVEYTLNRHGGVVTYSFNNITFVWKFKINLSDHIFNFSAEYWCQSWFGHVLVKSIAHIMTCCHTACSEIISKPLTDNSFNHIRLLTMLVESCIITRIRSSRMRTDRGSSHLRRGVSHPLTRHQSPLWPDTHPLLPGHVTSDAFWEEPDCSPCEQTNTCENITFYTPYAVGKKLILRKYSCAFKENRRLCCASSKIIHQSSHNSLR